VAAVVKVVGLGPFIARLNKLPPKLRRKEVMFKKMSIYLMKWIDKNFKTEGRYAQGGWPKLAASTIRQRRGGGRGGVKILQDTGRGRASIRTKHTRSYAKAFTRLDYMVKHHEGKGVPQRKIIPEAKQVERPVMRIAQRHVEEAIRRSGL